MFQLKISLSDISPSIWRRVLVPEEMTLIELHDLIQEIFAWQDYHLHRFDIRGMTFVCPPDWEEDGDKYHDGRKTALKTLIPGLVPEGSHFSYVYDLGDHWTHQIVVEKVLPDDPQQKPPVVLKGRRAGPPEDVGGEIGYERFLQALQNPDHPEHETLLNWVGGAFDPEAFDLAALNHRLKSRLRRAALIRQSSWPMTGVMLNFRESVQRDWARTASPAERDMVRDLPLRRDMMAMLTYLQTHRVKGTASTGNFPLKHVRGMAAEFVTPVALDQRIGDRIYKLRTEDDVEYLVFLHTLAAVGGLIMGGENLPWEVTEGGAVFLSQPPEVQFWFLIRDWFSLVNWFYLSRAAVNFALEDFQAVAFDIFSNCPMHQSIPVEDLVADFQARLSQKSFTSDSTPDYWPVYRLVVRALAFPWHRFGLLELIANPEAEGHPGIFIPKAVKLTPLSHRLLPLLDWRRRR